MDACAGVFSRGTVYMTLNVVSAIAIVIVNKTILTTLHFHFTVCLTLLHTIATMAAMELCTRLGMFERKELEVSSVGPIAVSYVGYIALSNLSLQLNSVAFYTIAKVGVVPAVMALEIGFLGKTFSAMQYASVALVCLGAGICTVQDLQISTTTIGALCALSAVLSTALYQLWAGSQQRALDASSAQLLHQASPYAAVLLTILVLVFEPVMPGFDPARGSILGYQYSFAAVSAILLSCVLGVAVSLTTFLSIGATSSLSYNVIGHIKTVSNLLSGYIVFGDHFSVTQLGGMGIALAGIGWFSQLKLASAPGKVEAISPEATDEKEDLLVKSGESEV